LIGHIARIRLLACAAASLSALAGAAGPITAHAGDVITGSGFMNGTLSFALPGVEPLVAYAPGNTPPVHVAVGSCSTVSWSYNDLLNNLSSGGAVVDESALVWYQGLVSVNGLTGTGPGECPGFIIGGTWNLASVTGSFPTHQSVNCGNMGGQYDRVGSIVLALGSYGGCSVQAYAPGPVTFKVFGQLTPSNVGGGVAAYVTGAYFDAVWEASFPA
jgi:hypothetical protein